MQRQGVSRVFVALVLLLLAVSGALFVVSFLGAPSNPTTTAAQAATKQFLDDLGSGRVDAAHRLGSTAFQDKQQPGDLQQFLKQHPGLTGHTALQFQPFVSTLTSANGVVSVGLSGQVNGPGGTTPFDVTLVQENAVWKVDAITFYSPQP